MAYVRQTPKVKESLKAPEEAVKWKGPHGPKETLTDMGYCSSVRFVWTLRCTGQKNGVRVLLLWFGLGWVFVYLFDCFVISSS